MKSTAALDAIQQAVLHRDISVLAAQRAYASLGGDPSSLRIPCEADGCDQSMKLGDSHSVIGVAHTIFATLAVTGPAHVLPTQCDDEQHYGCSLEHALSAHIDCLRNHVFPKHQERINAHHASLGITDQDITADPAVETAEAIAAELPEEDKERFLRIAHTDIDACSPDDQAWYRIQRETILHKWNVTASARRNMEHAATRDPSDSDTSTDDTYSSEENA